MLIETKTVNDRGELLVAFSSDKPITVEQLVELVAKRVEKYIEDGYSWLVADYTDGVYYVLFRQPKHEGE